MKSVLNYILLMALLVISFLVGWNFLFPVTSKNNYEQDQLQSIERLNKDLSIKNMSNENPEHIYYNLISEYEELASFYQKQQNELEGTKIRKLYLITRKKWIQSIAKARQGKYRKVID